MSITETKTLSSTPLAGKFKDMLTSRSFWLLFLLSLFFMSCTSHPVISPEPLKPNETYKGVVVSAENMIPQFVYRKGMGERMDVGVRLGMIPVHGSGIDMSFVLRDEGKRLHSMNFAATYAEQSSIEATYYNAVRLDRTKRIRRDGKVFMRTEIDAYNYRYLGMRYVYLPTGFWGDNIHLFGLLYGVNFQKSWGAELGYFHDFTGRTPESEYRFNPKYAPLTGISLRLWFGLLTKK